MENLKHNLLEQKALKLIIGKSDIKEVTPEEREKEEAEKKEEVIEEKEELKKESDI